MSTDQSTEAVETAVKPKVSIIQCQQFLKEGKTRKEIAEYYGVPMSVMAEQVWSHPALKGLKTKRVFELELVDDREVVETATQAVIAEEAVLAMTEVVAEDVVTTEANQAFADNLQGEIGEEVSTSNWK